MKGIRAGFYAAVAMCIFGCAHSDKVNGPVWPYGEIVAGEKTQETHFVLDGGKAGARAGNVTGRYADSVVFRHRPDVTSNRVRTEVQRRFGEVIAYHGVRAASNGNGASDAASSVKATELVHQNRPGVTAEALRSRELQKDQELAKEKRALLVGRSIRDRAAETGQARLLAKTGEKAKGAGRVQTSLARAAQCSTKSVRTGDRRIAAGKRLASDRTSAKVRTVAEERARKTLAGNGVLVTRRPGTLFRPDATSKALTSRATRKGVINREAVVARKRIGASVGEKKFAPGIVGKSSATQSKARVVVAKPDAAATELREKSFVNSAGSTLRRAASQRSVVETQVFGRSRPARAVDAHRDSAAFKAHKTVPSRARTSSLQPETSSRAAKVLVRAAKRVPDVARSKTAALAVRESTKSAAQVVPLGAVTWRVASPAKDSAKAEKPVISLRKRVNRVHAATGDVLVYTISYENVGDGDAVGLTITDVAPSRTRYVENSAGGTSADVEVRRTQKKTIIRWSIRGAVHPGERGEVYFKVFAE